jgi:hypothetical protein
MISRSLNESICTMFIFSREIILVKWNLIIFQWMKEKVTFLSTNPKVCTQEPC